MASVIRTLLDGSVDVDFAWITYAQLSLCLERVDFWSNRHFGLQYVVWRCIAGLLILLDLTRRSLHFLALCFFVIVLSYSYDQ